MHRLLILSLAAILAPSSARASEPNSSTAYLVGQYNVGCEMKGDECRSPYNSVSIRYRGVNGTKGNGELKVNDSIWKKTPLDLTDTAKKMKGIYFCEPIKPGTYSFYTYSFWNTKYGGYGYGLSKDFEFDLPVHAESGEVIDIGAITLTSETRKVLGLTEKIPGSVVVEPISDHTRALALSKCPKEVQSRTVRQAPFDASKAGSPVVTQGPAN